MSDDEGGNDNYDPQAPNPTDNEPQEPSGERTVTTQGITYVLKQEDHHKTLEEDEEAVHVVCAFSCSCAALPTFPRPSSSIQPEFLPLLFS